MSQTFQIIFAILALIGVLLVSRQIHAWRFRRAFEHIVNDLRSRNAFDPDSAAEVPYAKRNLLHMGLRDFRPAALRHLVINDIVGTTESGRYYIKDPKVQRG